MFYDYSKSAYIQGFCPSGVSCRVAGLIGSQHYVGTQPRGLFSDLSTPVNEGTLFLCNIHN